MKKEEKAKYLETEKELNAKILAITMKIRENYPELSKYLEEMKVTIPDQKNPEINCRSLQKYYDSLQAMLNNYTLGRPDSDGKRHMRMM